MSKSNFLELATLDATYGGQAFPSIATIYVGLFTTLPAEDGTGGTEVSGGSYARASVTNNLTEFPSANPKQNANEIAFAQATANWGVVKAWGTFDAASAGNMLHRGWLTGAWKAFTAATTDTITSPAHGFSDNDEVIVTPIPNNSLPTGLTEGTTYHVINSATDTFQVSATQGGAAVDITGAGVGYVAKLDSRDVKNGDTLKIPANGITIREG